MADKWFLKQGPRQFELILLLVDIAVGSGSTLAQLRYLPIFSTETWVRFCQPSCAHALVVLLLQWNRDGIRNDDALAEAVAAVRQSKKAAFSPSFETIDRSKRCLVTLR
jgi:hypothetical protein